MHRIFLHLYIFNSIYINDDFILFNSQFANSLWELSVYFSDDPEIIAFLNKLIHALQEMNKYHTILLDQASRTVMKDLNNFIKW